MARGGSQRAKRTLARNVRRWRAERDYTQHELAARASVTQALVSALEGASANPTLESLDRVALALGLSIADLFEEAERRR